MRLPPAPQRVLARPVPPGPLRELQVPPVTLRQGRPHRAHSSAGRGLLSESESLGEDREATEASGREETPGQQRSQADGACSLRPAEAWTLGLSQGARG